MCYFVYEVIRMDNINTKKNIGYRLATLFSKTNKKQKELAEYLEVKPNVVSYFVNGERVPNTEQVIKIATFFNVSTDYLLGLTDVTTTNKDLKFICDYTGLSEKSVITLNKFKEMANGDIGIDDVPEKFYKYTLCETFDEERTLREYIFTSKHMLMFLNGAINNSYITDIAENACDWHLIKDKLSEDLEEYRYIKACLKLLKSCELEFKKLTLTNEDINRTVQLMVETCKKAGEL